MTKKRHHYVPRVLLNRFASWSDPDRNKYKIWRYWRNSAALEVSAKDIAVRKNFYGDNDLLENALSIEEGHLANVFRHLEDGKDIEMFAEDLSRFVWLQSFRMLSFRSRLSGTFRSGLAEMARSTSGRSFQLGFRNKAFQKINEYISQMSLDDYLELSYNTRFIGLYEFIKLIIESYVLSGSAAAEMQDLFSAMLSSGIVEDSGEEALNKTLAQALSERGVPAAWQLRNWAICKYDSNIILGDCCILAGSSSENIGPVCDAENWDLVIFPIDPRTCLMGYKSTIHRSFSAPELNLISAKSSFFEFYASESREDHRLLEREIGSNVAMISQENLTEISRNAWLHD